MNQDSEEKKRKKGQGFTIGLAMGIPLGIPIGIAMDNLAIGPAIGLAIGAGIGIAMEAAYNKREEIETPERSSRKKMLKIFGIGVISALLLTLVLLYIYAKTR